MTNQSKPAGKTAAAKDAQKSTPAGEVRGKSDTQHPDVHPDLHSASGMQEPNTAGAPDVSKDTPVASGMVIIGANAPDAGAQPGSAPVDGEKAAKEEFIFSHDQALALPLVDKGTPMKQPSESTLKAYHAKKQKEAIEHARLHNESVKDDQKTDLSTIKQSELTPITAFKDPISRKTMVVVKSDNGLAKMEQKPS